MPKQWVSRTFGTCVPRIQAAGLCRLPTSAATSSPWRTVEAAPGPRLRLLGEGWTGHGLSQFGASKRAFGSASAPLERDRLLVRTLPRARLPDSSPARQ